ncbi:hypothetical protein HD597_004349 [Nonomuraea thailandensis]|uniref:Uncharacterized protein n=1 Tax=Nonomuraea thailandensis TaxID=1188745 RepID=A0A9X2GDZ2_9ACTN|nr:hypothetical protein [Nonomuraea thailandensis]
MIYNVKAPGRSIPPTCVPVVDARGTFREQAVAR